MRGKDSGRKERGGQEGKTRKKGGIRRQMGFEMLI